MHLYPILWAGDIETRSSTRPTKNQSPDRHASTKQQRGTTGFPQYYYYLGKFSPGTADVCGLLCKLTSSKAIWTWNASYQALFNKTKLLIKSDMCMKFHYDTKLLYLETDASGIGLGAALLQT